MKNTANDSSEVTRLSAENTMLNAECERLENELQQSNGERERLNELNSSMREQLAVMQQQLASVTMQLAKVTVEGTEPMMPIGAHAHFDPAKISRLSWDRSKPTEPILFVDTTPVWWSSIPRPELLKKENYDTPQNHAEATEQLAEWSALCQREYEKVLAAINAAKRDLAERRQQGKTT